MPLSPPAARRHIHTRKVTCTGYRREDGMWDIEGHITDEKTYAFDNAWRGSIAPGEFIHEMWVRLTVDDSFTVRAVEAVTDHSPFPVCPSITPAFQKLIGLKIVSGWTAAVKERLGGVQGCTHLVELLGPVATTAFQTIGPMLAKEREAARKAEEEAARAEGRPPSPAGRPVLLNTCHAFRSDGPIVKKAWPAYYTGPEEGEAATGSGAA